MPVLWVAVLEVQEAHSTPPGAAGPLKLGVWLQDPLRDCVQNQLLYPARIQ